jgi:hypothetical protein
VESKPAPFKPKGAAPAAAGPPSPISETSIIEYWLEDGFQPIEQRLLTHAIIDRGYTEHAILAGFVPLRDRVLSHRQRLIAVLFQLSLQPIQLLLQLRFESLQTLPIYSSLLLMPFGFHLAMDTLPSEVQQAVALGRSWLYPAFAFVPV